MSAFIQSDKVVQKAFDGRLMRRILGYLRPYSGRAGLAIVLVAVAGWDEGRR